MAMMISWVMPVNPSHPYLENDPAPSFAPTICAFHLGFSLGEIMEDDGMSSGTVALSFVGAVEVLKRGPNTLSDGTAFSGAIGSADAGRPVQRFSTGRRDTHC